MAPILADMDAEIYVMGRSRHREDPHNIDLGAGATAALLSSSRVETQQPRDRTRRELLADAAIEVIAAEGLRGLTHRGVDVRAAVPTGTTSYYFRTRLALLKAALDRIVALDDRMLDSYPLTEWRLDDPADRERAADILTDVLVYWLGPARDRTAARLEMYLTAARQPDLRTSMEAASRRFHDRTRELFQRGHAADPDEAAYACIAALDGLLFDAVARPFFGGSDRRRLRGAVESVLRGLVR